MAYDNPRPGAPRPDGGDPRFVNPEQVKLLAATVGRIINVDNEGRNYGTGFIVRSPYESLPYVVTAQHNINPNWKNTSPRVLQTQERTFVLPSGRGTIRLGEAHYPRTEGQDIAVVRVDPADQHLVGDLALDIDTTGRDYEKYLCAGYGQGNNGELTIYEFERSLWYRNADTFHGLSGGPMFTIVDGEIKVFSIHTTGANIEEYVLGGGELTDEDMGMYYSPRGVKDMASILDRLLKFAVTQGNQ